LPAAQPRIAVAEPWMQHLEKCSCPRAAKRGRALVRADNLSGWTANSLGQMACFGSW